MRTTPFRVLLYAHVDLNVVDGSAFFVAGASSLLTSAPGVEVDVVTATPIKRAVVVQEMLANPAVKVVDPFRDEGLALRRPEFRTITRMDEATAGSMLVHYLDRGSYDVVLVRSSEVADTVAHLRPDLGSRLCVYVTGVVSGGRPLEESLLGRLRHLASSGATLLCQTPEMSEHLAELLGPAARPGSLAVMRPAVPAGPPVKDPPADGALVVAYTGKFARAWNTVEMLAGFKQAASRVPGMRLLVAGDHFKSDPTWPTFAAEAKYLLGSHPQITWVGGVTREEARDLVTSADVGLGWRAASLDDSLELSTKILENGALGRPTILNPTPMHRRLFGADYPLFASSMTDFVDLLERVARDRSLLVEAAGRMAQVAADYTYERVFDELFPTLVRAGTADHLNDGATGVRADVARLVRSGGRLEVRDGRATAWLARASDGDLLLAASTLRGASPPVERFGPFVRWRVVHPETADQAATPDVHRALHLALEALASDDGSPSDGCREGPVDPVVIHDRSGRVRLGSASASPPTTSGTGMTEEESTRLAGELRRQAAESDLLRQQYTALSTSVLGRTQLLYWRLLARLRRGVTRPG